jgi:hypothetical protein
LFELYKIKSNQIKSNQIKSNQIKSNQIKSNQIKSLTVAACIRICFSTEDQASILTRPLRVRHGLNPDSDSEFGVEGHSAFGVAGNATEFGVEANAAFEVEGIAAFGIATELGVAGNAAFEVKGNAALEVESNAAFEVEGNAVEFVVVGNAKPSPEAPKINKKNN